MRERGDVPPKTIGVELRSEGVAVEYLDGRTTLYRGVPRPVAESVTIPPETEIHVLITDPSETEGVMVYVNDLKTEDGILEDTGVGRIVLSSGAETEAFPGVTVGRRSDERTTIDADLDAARGRVFVFAEDDWIDRRYEFVPPEQVANDEDAATDARGAGDGERTPDGDRSTDATEADQATGTDPHGVETTDDGRDGADDADDPDDTDNEWIEEPAVREPDG